jgi:hypothetical protein
MSLPSLLNVPKTLEDWQRWSFSNAQDHINIIQAIQADTGNITGVELTNGGSGYTSIPNVVLDPSGTGATFNISISGGKITSITVNTEGHGYRSTMFEITGGGGTGATGVIALNPIIMLPQYQLDPINFESPFDFIRRHAQSHTDMNGALGLQSIDLSELDINDPSKVESWIYSNYQEHNNAHNVLQI